MCYVILFNHDSIYRKKNFLYKILLETLKKNNSPKAILIENINDIKFRSDAEKIVQVIWKILQKKRQDDYIISTNKSISVENLIKKIALKYKIDLKWKMTQNAIRIYKKNNLIIKSYKNINKYKIKPNLSKIKTNLKINTKNLSLF